MLAACLAVSSTDDKTGRLRFTGRRRWDELPVWRIAAGCRPRELGDWFVYRRTSGGRRTFHRPAELSWLSRSDRGEGYHRW